MQKVFSFLFVLITIQSITLATFDYKFERTNIDYNIIDLNSAIIINDSIIITCGDYGCIRRSTDSGKSFQTVNGKYYDNNLLSLTKNQNNYVFAVGNNGEILYSSDNGIRWYDVNKFTDNTINDIEFTDNTGFIGTNNGELFISNNNGIDWIVSNTSFESGINKIYLHTDKSIYLGLNNGAIYISKDLGQSWTKMISVVGNCINDICYLNDTTLLLAGNSSNLVELNILDNTVNNLKISNNQLLDIYSLSIIKDSFIYITTNEQFWNQKYQLVSLDKGKTWNEVDAFADINKFIYNSTCKIGIGVGVNGAIIRGTDTLINEELYLIQYGYAVAGKQITPINFNVSYLDCYDPANVMVVGSFGVFISNDSSISFNKLYSNTDFIEGTTLQSTFCKYYSDNDYIIIADSIKFVNSNQVKKSYIFRKHVGSNLEEVFESQWEENFIDFTCKNSLCIARRGLYYFISKDMGNNWSKGNLPENTVIASMQIDNNNIIYLRDFTTEKVYKSKDFGDTWLETPVEFDSYKLHFLNENDFVMIKSAPINNQYYDLRIYTSNDGGNSINMKFKSPDGISYKPALVNIEENIPWIITTNDKVIISNNRGDNWEESIPVKDTIIFIGAKACFSSDGKTAFIGNSDKIYRFKLIPSLNVANDYLKTNNYNISPIPATENITISSKDIMYSITIIDITGNEIFKSDRIEDKSFRLDVSSIVSGMYIAIIDFGNKRESKSFVISR